MYSSTVVRAGTHERIMRLTASLCASDSVGARTSPNGVNMPYRVFGLGGCSTTGGTFQTTAPRASPLLVLRRPPPAERYAVHGSRARYSLAMSRGSALATQTTRGQRRAQSLAGC